MYFIIYELIMNSECSFSETDHSNNSCYSKKCLFEAKTSKRRAEYVKSIICASEEEARNLKNSYSNKRKIGYKIITTKSELELFQGYTYSKDARKLSKGSNSRNNDSILYLRAS